MRTSSLAGPGTGLPASGPLGLPSPEAAQRLAVDGFNVLPAPHPVPLWRRVLAQLRDPLVLVLLAAAVLTSATGDWTDASVIILVVVVNTTAGIIQEVKADHAISALTRLAAPEARVIRDGAQQQIAAADVVRGDLRRSPRRPRC
jgi:P-type Ca2+ transporter type 2C